MKTFILITYLLCVAVTFAHAENVRVTVKENTIRGDCRFYAPVKLRVRAGDMLTVIGKSGDWYRVSFKGVSGCIHRGAVESRTYAVTGSGGRQGGASRDEVSLAGKGFNPEVEKSYRSSNPTLDFSAVDSLEKITVDEGQLRNFIDKGGLNLP